VAKRALRLAVILTALSFGFGVAGDASGQIIDCTGRQEDGLCWLRGSHTGDRVTWAFHDVPHSGRLVLEIAAVGDDPTSPRRGRDVGVFVYIGEPGASEWRRFDARLRSEAREGEVSGYTLRATIPFNWKANSDSGTVLVRIRQAVHCEPYVGFDDHSVSLGRPVAPEPVTPVAVDPDVGEPEDEPEPDEPEPAWEEEVCVIPTQLGCWEGDPSELCPEYDPFRVEVRETLPNSPSPARAPWLSPGHYEGTLGARDPDGRLNIRDWYKLETPVGQGIIIWVEGDPELEFDVYIADICGVVKHRLVGGPSTIYCVAPCVGPDDGVCKWLLRIERRSGQGEYRLSLFTDELDS